MILILILATIVCSSSSSSSSFKNIPNFEIAPNVFMPVVNAGHPDDNSTETSSAKIWLEKGGRGIDTAYDYHNQDQVGEAIRESGLPRDSLFITTKISPLICSSSNALDAVKRDLKELQLDYVDLVLHHFPCADSNGNVDVWKGLEMAMSQNLTRSIGVSNYVQEDIEPILNLKSVVPALNQAQMSVGSHDDDTIAFCKTHGITYESYSPLRHVNLTNSDLVSIAERYNVSTAQVCLRWIVQQEIVIATSPGVNELYVEADLELDTFSLSRDEMQLLSSLSFS